MALHASLLQSCLPLSDTQSQKFSFLTDLYREWNQKINLISRKDIDHIVERHLLHALSIAKLDILSTQSTVIDIGTGGGIPGIPLAIYYPNIHFHLIDSVGKKINAVRHIVQTLGLQNVTSYHDRVEHIRHIKADYILSRAVAPLHELVFWSKHLINTHSKHINAGLLCLKGGDLTTEIREACVQTTEYKLSEVFPHLPFYESKSLLQIPKEELYKARN